ncbi:MAG: hypothetical protein JNK65_09325 [Deltaproteobacteria bacterium]|nr:hypothetical protein [Deltaproteobacteria bacterium]
MSSIDSGLPPISPDILKMEYRQVVGGNVLEKPTFGEKFKMFAAKAGGFLGRIAGAVLPFFGPLGMVGSVAAYGLSRFSQGAVDKMYAKRQMNAQKDAEAASFDPQQAGLWAPGFAGNMGGSTPNPSDIQVAPFAQPYKNEIMNTLNNRGAAALNSIGSVQVGTSL